MDTVQDRLEIEFGWNRVFGGALGSGFFEVFVTVCDGTVYQVTCHCQREGIFPGRKARWQFTLLNFGTPRTFFVGADTERLHWDSPPPGIEALGSVDRSVLLRIAAAVVGCKAVPFSGDVR